MSSTIENLRNIAIIAHVDRGKTTLVDKLLQASGTLDRKDQDAERVMDSNDQKKACITILAKTPVCGGAITASTSDTPGHADFGGVEQSCRWLFGLAGGGCRRGPMPQTRFVTQKLRTGFELVILTGGPYRARPRGRWNVRPV